MRTRRSECGGRIPAIAHTGSAGAEERAQAVVRLRNRSRETVDPESLADAIAELARQQKVA